MPSILLHPRLTDTALLCIALPRSAMQSAHHTAQYTTSDTKAQTNAGSHPYLRSEQETSKEEPLLLQHSRLEAAKGYKVSTQFVT